MLAVRACAVPNLHIRIKYLCVAAVFFCILQRWTSGYILKRERFSASIKEGGDREDEENKEEDDREEIEILEEDQEARQKMVEIQEKKDGDDRQKETVEILEEEDGDARQVETVETLEDGNRDEEQEEIEVMEEKDGTSTGARKRKVGRLDSSKHLVQYIPNGRVSFLGLYQRKILVKLLGCCVACE